MHDRIENIAPEWVRNSESNPDKMLRILPLDGRTPAELAESLAVLERGETLFKNLQDNYGIHIPEMQTSIHHNDNGTVEAQVEVDKIDGVNVEEIAKLPAAAKDKLDQFFFGLTEHYRDVFKNGGDFWFDFRDDQLLYGHKSGEKDDFIYMVDVDPEYQTYNPDKKTQGKRLFRLLARVYESVKIMEGKLPYQMRLEKTRRLLYNVISTISENEPFYDEHIRQVKGQLEQEETLSMVA